MCIRDSYYIERAASAAKPLYDNVLRKVLNEYEFKGILLIRGLYSYYTTASTLYGLTAVLRNLKACVETNLLCERVLSSTSLLVAHVALSFRVDGLG